MSKITNDGLTSCGIGCFIAAYRDGNNGYQRVKPCSTNLVVVERVPPLIGRVDLLILLSSSRRRILVVVVVVIVLSSHHHVVVVSPPPCDVISRDVISLLLPLVLGTIFVVIIIIVFCLRHNKRTQNHTELILSFILRLKLTAASTGGATEGVWWGTHLPTFENTSLVISPNLHRNRENGEGGGIVLVIQQ